MDKKLSEEYKIVCEMIDLYHRKNDKFSDGCLTLFASSSSLLSLSF